MTARFSELPLAGLGIVALLGIASAISAGTPPGVDGWGPVALSALLCICVAGAVLVAAAGRVQPRHLVSWVVAAGVLLGALLAAVWFRQRNSAVCLATYENRATAIGTELTAVAAEYRRTSPELTNDELLFDAAGQAERVWTGESVAACRVRLQAFHILPAPLAVALAGALLQAIWIRRRSARTLSAPAPAGGASAVSPSPREIRYDAFISYRHGPPDEEFAQELVEKLERQGLRVALDKRDFRPNQPFLLEMERCVKESRFTLSLITARYLASGNCEEEAIISKVLDMGERKRRLIPLFLEPCESPVWLYGLTGVSFHDTAAPVDPFERLVAAVKTAGS